MNLTYNRLYVEGSGGGGDDDNDNNNNNNNNKDNNNNNNKDIRCVRWLCHINMGQIFNRYKGLSCIIYEVPPYMISYPPHLARNLSTPAILITIFCIQPTYFEHSQIRRSGLAKGAQYGSASFR